MRVLVTGGAGFIGSHVVDGLVARGAEVIVVDSLDPAAHAANPGYLHDVVDYRWVALDDADAVAAAVERVDAVCHQAARVGLGLDFDDVTRYVHDNDAGTATLLRAAVAPALLGPTDSRIVDGGLWRGPVLVCRARRCAGLDRDRPMISRARRFEPRCPKCGSPLAWAAIDESAPLDPRNVYAATKVHTEHLAFAYGRETGTDVSRVALPQRVRPSDASQYAVRGRRQHLPERARSRPRAATSSRTAARSATSSTSMMSLARTCWRSSPHGPAPSMSRPVDRAPFSSSPRP